jgi:DNA polymerase III subunit gamma/tau
MKIEGMTRELANNCILENIDENSCNLIVDPGHRHLCGGIPEEKLKLAIQKFSGKPIKVSLTVAQNALETPAVERSKALEDRQKAAITAINEDPAVQALKEQFGARIMPGTIEPL